MFVVIYKDPDGEEDVCENEQGNKLFKTLKEADQCVEWLSNMGYYGQLYRICKLTFID